MSKEELLEKHCHEQPKETKPLTEPQANEYLALVSGWELTTDGKAIIYKLKTPGFLAATQLVGKIAVLADKEDHHPDIRIHSYRQLEIIFSTHSIGGLSENDFIMAAKLEEIINESGYS